MKGRPITAAAAAAVLLALTSQATISVAQAPGKTVIDGVFDVGGHGLYLNCQGSGSPTIVYMHGWSTGLGSLAHANGAFAQRALSDEYRVCVYDRRNVGLSETVDAAQLPEDAIADMHGLLDAAGVEPPYVLLGASFGGLLSDLYAITYPDEVVGMVLLDSMFPDELSLDPLFAPQDRYDAFDAADETESLERISHYKAMKAAADRIGDEPAIPVVYLSSIPEGFDVNDYGLPEYDEQVLRLQEAFVERFSPGTYVRVESPHFMEAAIPDQIVEALRSVIEQAGHPSTSQGEGAEASSAAPTGIIALGHSGLTGENSDPARPGEVALENSWATGTNPEVASIYERLVAARPENAGHVSNRAQGGAPSDALAAQAALALRDVPEPALAIIQTIDGDIRCDGTDEAHVPEFGQAVEAALDVIGSASPKTRILIVSQPGRPETDAMARSEDPAVTSLLRGDGICDFFDPAGAYRPDRVAALTAIIEGHEAEQARVCAEIPQCTDDGGVLARDPRDAAYVSSDWGHLVVAGHAHVAELLWPVVSSILGLPA